MNHSFTQTNQDAKQGHDLTTWVLFKSKGPKELWIWLATFVQDGGEII